MHTLFLRVSAACSVFLVLVASLSTSASANLIANPGFEQPLGGEGVDWENFVFTSTSVQDTSMPHTGNGNLLMSGGTSSTGATGVFQRVLGTVPNQEYTLSAWAKVDALPIGTDDPDGGANMQLEWHGTSDGGTNELSQELLSIGPLLTTEYQKFTITGFAPANALHMRPVLVHRHNDRIVYWDDVVLETVLPPDTPIINATVDRSTGNISLENVGTGDANIREVSITSAFGGLDPISWSSIAGNYDLAGNGTVDANDNWTKQTQTNAELRESETTGDGGVIAIGQTVDFGNDTWIQSATEDVKVVIEYDDGGTPNVIVNYVGGPGDSSFVRGDLNFDGSLDSLDWPLLREQLFVDISSSSGAEAYQSGDLNGDFQTNFGDFILFKQDFNAANGAGAFEAMIASVPEPSSLALLAFGVFGISLSRKRRTVGSGKVACLMLVALTAVANVPTTSNAAQSVDLSTFTVDDYPLIDGSRFNLVTYTTTSNSAVLDVSSNPHVFHGGASILNKRITGTINPGADNDYIGLALGYTAGDTTKPLGAAGAADFLLLDWKFDNSSQDMSDDSILAGPPTFQFFHDSTAGKEASRGLALSRISGTPTGDELWGHVNSNNSGAFDDNPLGGVTELQRGTTHGFTGYVKNRDHVFDITYTASQIIVKVDGNEEINLAGSFPDGVLGLYSMDQNPLNGAATYSNFKVSELDEILTATINTLSGSVTLSNASGTSIDLDGYRLESASSSLNASTWSSLQDQNLAGFEAGNGSGSGWEEADASSNSTLSEANLMANSVLGAGASVSLGTAFDVSGSQDLVFTYADSDSGLVTSGFVNYVSSVENANFDGDSNVDGADFLRWQRGVGTGSTLAQGDANGSGSVDGSDLAIWKSQYGTSGLLSGVQAVPEPSSAVLLVLAALGLGLSKSRR